MLGFQPLDLLIIVVIAVLFFAPQRLPEMVRSIKKAASEFKSSLNEKDKTS